MELAIIIFYLIAIFGVGIYCNKFNNTIDDYLLAGRRLGLGLATGTLVATYFGGGYVIGVGSEAYQMGASSYWSPIAGAVGILAVCLVLKKMEGMRVYTVTEIMENRYQSAPASDYDFIPIGFVGDFGRTDQFRRKYPGLFGNW